MERREETSTGPEDVTDVYVIVFSDGSPVFQGFILGYLGLKLLEWVHRPQTAGYPRGSVSLKG